MQKQRFFAILMLLFLLFETGCPGCDKPKKRHRGDTIDGGYVMLEECDKLVVDCFDRCHARDAGNRCYGCCGDEGFLCNTHKPYSLEHCDGAR